MNDRVAKQLERVLDAHGDRAAEARCWWVPGRIEVLGKHTDYADGRSLLCAAEYGFTVAACPRADRMLRIIDVASGDYAEGELSTDVASRAGHWSNYPFTVARRVALNFPGQLRGVDLAFASDLPIAAGMSSSSAFVVATFLALADANGLSSRDEHRPIDAPEHLAEYLGAVENGRTYGALAGDQGVGTLGGSEDHTAILCARVNSLIQGRFIPVRLERTVAFPSDNVFVIAMSGVVAEKSGAAMKHYNEVAERAAAVLDVWRSFSGSAAPTLAAALEESADAFERIDEALQRCRHARFSADSLRARLRQFRDETFDIIPKAGDALAAGDWTAFGSLVDRSQRGAEEFLGNQIPETIFLARAARELGALAASAFGAGFGGSVYAIVPSGDAEEFMARWAERYHAAFSARGGDSNFFMTGAGPAAMRVGGGR